MSVLDFAAHRANLFARMANQSVAIIPSATQYIRNRDAEFPFRQDSDFFYLTGFTEDHACLVMIKKTRQL